MKSWDDRSLLDSFVEDQALGESKDVGVEDYASVLDTFRFNVLERESHVDDVVDGDLDLVWKWSWVRSLHHTLFRVTVLGRGIERGSSPSFTGLSLSAANSVANPVSIGRVLSAKADGLVLARSII